MKPDELAALVAELVGAERIEGVQRLSGGASREMWSCDAVDGDGSRRPLVVRVARAGAAGPATVGGTVSERGLLDAAARAGVPVPPVVAATDDDRVLVCERVEGETIARKILRDDRFATARTRLAGQCGRALAAIHRIPAEEVPGLEVVDSLERFREVLDQFGQPHPTFELASRWLEANRPAPTPTAVVHGDFRNGNLIVGPDGLRAVLDWEIAHLGDPMEDLGWLCVKAWRFGVNDRRVGGFGDVDDLLSSYGEASGRTVEPDVVRWWEVLGTWKWGIICIVQSFTHLLGTTRSVELATIGRRVCENEWDLLDLFDELGWPRPRP